nr:proline--tRNA ligase [Actinomycetota bacterium]
VELGRAPAAQTLMNLPTPMIEHHTPGRPGVDAVVEYFAGHSPPAGEAGHSLTAAGMLKCIAFFDEDGNPLLALVPGDREVQPRVGWRAFAREDFAGHPHLIKGYIGPMGLQAHGVRVVADVSTNFNRYWATGANRDDHHVTNAVLGRDFAVDEWAPLTAIEAGDPCPTCGDALGLVQAVEVCHAFQLGDRYSNRLPAGTFRSESGAEAPFWMGCYGVGLSRLIAVVAEAHHDDGGLVWPAALAPYGVHLIALRGTEAEADDLYGALVAAGVAVLYDDRDVSAGVKFADADLLGVPVQLVVGRRGLADGVVERKDRATGARTDVAVESVAASL